MSRWPEREPLGDANDPRGFEALLARYLDWLAVHHYSETTIEAARHLLRQFGGWCLERGVPRPAGVSREALERYQRFLFHYRQEDGRPLAFRTQQQRLVRVKGFFRWLAKERYLLYDPAAALVLPQKPPRLPTDVFSVAEVEQILATADTTTALGLRDRAMLETLYSTGLRRSELARLDVFDVDRDRGWVTVRQGKGSKDRVVPIGDRALAWVVRYLEQARPELVLVPSEWALFLTVEGSRFTPDSLGFRVTKILELSGVRRRHGGCHLFRHTCATLMLEAGADIRYIQEMLGHASLGTTEIYTRVSIQKLKQIHSATHPAARLERRTEDDAGGGDAAGGAGDV